MAFEMFELSRWLGRPVHLFVFTHQSLVYRFNSSDRDITIAGNTYLAAVIARSEVNETTERAKNELTIQFPFLLDPVASQYPVTQEFGSLFRPYAPSGKVSVVCMVVHINDGDLQAKLDWTGRVVSPKFTDTQLTLTCERVASRKNFRGNTGRFTRGCCKALYECGVAFADHAFPATLTDVDGLTLTAAEFGAYADGRLEGGVITWTRSNGLVETRSINKHVGSTVTINYGGAELAAGLAIAAAPGCAHTYADCGDYFGNTPNYGGQPQLNVENPFDGHRIAW